jgi:hypothetical protein
MSLPNSTHHSITVTPEEWAIIEASTPADYDGHTAFAQMTPAQRLEWLDSAVAFICEFGGTAGKATSRASS